jgi:hypothetical protein
MSSAHSVRVPDSTLRRYAAATTDWLLGFPRWCRYRARQPQTFIVLGMHRSGTSCITRIINLAGLSLGGPVAGANPSNPAGHWESLEGMAVNDLILQVNGGSWDEPPARLAGTGWLRVKMRRFLGNLHRNGAAVWKDPRTILTFPLWKPLLGTYCLLATFRHPMSVARSLQRRDGFTLEKGLSLWRHYNERLLALCTAEEEVYWVDFDAEAGRLHGQLKAFADSAGLQLRADALASYNPALRTSDNWEARLDDATERLYARLREASGSRSP